jgi:hypothetical protein
MRRAMSEVINCCSCEVRRSQRTNSRRTGRCNFLVDFSEPRHLGRDVDKAVGDQCRSRADRAAARLAHTCAGRSQWTPVTTQRDRAADGERPRAICKGGAACKTCWWFNILCSSTCLGRVVRACAPPSRVFSPERFHSSLGTRRGERSTPLCRVFVVAKVGDVAGPKAVAGDKDGPADAARRSVPDPIDPQVKHKGPRTIRQAAIRPR